MQTPCVRKSKSGQIRLTTLFRLPILLRALPYDEVLDAIDAAPTIDPEALQPVAHWVCEEDYDGDPVVWTCSRCKDSSIMYDGTPKDNGFKFCPYCGAKMEE